jgi:hypothetical protein
MGGACRRNSIILVYQLVERRSVSRHFKIRQGAIEIVRDQRSPMLELEMKMTEDLKRKNQN